MAATIHSIDLQFNENRAERVGAPSGIVLHHAAGDGSIEDIHNYHKNQNGWAGIGYHFYVRKDGSIWRGRPESWLGAHTTGHNDKIGICAEGNFENDYMGQTQQNAIGELLVYLFVKYGELPVYGHRDLDSTACPGAHYPFEAITSEPTEEDNLIFAFQTASVKDGIALPRYGADGIWGVETATAAAKLLANGSIGERVKLIQRLLSPKYGADGIFGTETEAAVKAFQSQHGLAVDGIVGINTWKALLGVNA